MQGQGQRTTEKEKKNIRQRNCRVSLPVCSINYARAEGDELTIWLHSFFFLRRDRPISPCSSNTIPIIIANVTCNQLISIGCFRLLWKPKIVFIPVCEESISESLKKIQCFAFRNLPFILLQYTPLLTSEIEVYAVSVYLNTARARSFTWPPV